MPPAKRGKSLARLYTTMPPVKPADSPPAPVARRHSSSALRRAFLRLVVLDRLRQRSVTTRPSLE